LNSYPIGDSELKRLRASITDNGESSATQRYESTSLSHRIASTRYLAYFLCATHLQKAINIGKGTFPSFPSALDLLNPHYKNFVFLNYIIRLRFRYKENFILNRLAERYIWYMETGPDLSLALHTSRSSHTLFIQQPLNDQSKRFNMKFSIIKPVSRICMVNRLRHILRRQHPNQANTLPDQHWH